MQQDNDEDGPLTGPTARQEHNDRVTCLLTAANESVKVRLDCRSYLKFTCVLSAVLAGCTNKGIPNWYKPDTVVKYGVVQVCRTKSRKRGSNDGRQGTTRNSTNEPVTEKLAGDEINWYISEAIKGRQVAVQLSAKQVCGITLIILYDPDRNALDQIYVSDASEGITETMATSGEPHPQVMDREDAEREHSLAVTRNISTTTPTPTEIQTPKPTPVAEDYGTQGYGKHGHRGVQTTQ